MTGPSRTDRGNSEPPLKIFISAVSTELSAQRQLVAEALIALNCEPESQETFGIGQGILIDVLKQKIDKCQGMIQLDGAVRGAKAKWGERPGEQGSYTHFEADYAETMDKAVWYFLIDEAWCKTLANGLTPEEQLATHEQEVYRDKIRRSPKLYHTVTDDLDLTRTVQRMKPALADLVSGSQRQRKPDLEPERAGRERIERERQRQRIWFKISIAVTILAIVLAIYFFPTPPVPPLPSAPPHINSLGMKFVPVSVAGKDVRFSIWETRVEDYQAFIDAAKGLWVRPTFPQDPTHPAVNVSYNDAVAFCQWLTDKEGLKDKGLEYRLWATISSPLTSCVTAPRIFGTVRTSNGCCV